MRGYSASQLKPAYRATGYTKTPHTRTSLNRFFIIIFFLNFIHNANHEKAKNDNENVITYLSVLKAPFCLKATLPKFSNNIMCL